MANTVKDHALAQEVDDERRQVPEGWVRAFDRSSGHHFYAPVDPDENRSTWAHPYDDPYLLKSLPDDHPASPRSSAGQAAQQKAADEKARLANTGKGATGKEPGLLGKLFGTGEPGISHEEKTAIRVAEEAFRFRRDALAQGDLSATGTKSRYAPNPYGYPSPAEPFARPSASGVEYAYGYPGGYRRKYTFELGYDRVASERDVMGTAINSLLQGGGAPVLNHSKKTNYGYHG